MKGELQYDYIVVGGGTAGCVLAARLSEEPGRTVLLLEAGNDYVTADEIPAELTDGRYAVTSGHHWDLQAILREESFASAAGRAAKVLQVAANRLVMAQSVSKVLAFSQESLTRIAYPLAKVIGGGSSINGAIAFHGRPEDFARWVQLGNEWWSWDQVQPFMRRIEAQELHKASLPVQVASPETLTSLQRTFLEACLAAGFALTDSRQGLRDGVGITPKNIVHGRRVSAAAIYLDPARRRPNLTVQSGSLVDKLVISRRGETLRADGVELVIEGQRRCFAAKRVVLAAGAINSPAILLRSGIGAADEVRRIGGDCALHLPGVGKNLMDHPALFIWGVPDDMACSLGEPIHQVILQHRSQLAERCDLQLFMHSAVPTRLFPPLQDFIGADMAMGISVVLATPVSTGRVELTSRDPTASPAIHLNCGAEREDLRRLMQGARLAWSILQAPALRKRTKRILIWNQKIIDSDELLGQVITSTVRTSYHPTSTLRMRSSNDPGAVVDQYGRLHGCDNVTIADASIMPSIPSVPTSLTCMLIGERIAAHLHERSRIEPLGYGG